MGRSLSALVIFRLLVALVFAMPAAIAGYALVHGIAVGPWSPKSGASRFA
jgi:hypothetical protein